jgi:transposase
MGGRRFVVAWQDDVDTLFEKYKKEPSPQLRGRWQALWLLREGKGLALVAQTVGVHYRTVEEWVGWYRAGGLVEAARHQVGGPRRQGKRWLTDEQEALLKEKAMGDGFPTIASAVSWTADTLRVQLTQTQMRAVFKRLNMKKKVPRPVSDRASPEAQMAWKKGD